MTSNSSDLLPGGVADEVSVMHLKKERGCSIAKSKLEIGSQSADRSSRDINRRKFING